MYQKTRLVGVGAARVGTRDHKVLLVSERDISQGKYKLLFTAPEAIVDSRKQTLAHHVEMLSFSVLDYVIS